MQIYKNYLLNKITYKLKKIKQILNIDFYKNQFKYIETNKSDSEKRGNYLYSINKVLNSKRNFKNFKRDKNIHEVIENVDEKLGTKYLNILKSRNDGIIDKGLEMLLINDSIGNPFKYKYPGYKPLLSPVTLRYLKVASDINILFGNTFNKVAEIGCGYGGQALVNDYLFFIKESKLFDLPYVNKLIDKYLNYFLFKGSYKTTIINKEKVSNYDLVISNYAFSEMPKELQIIYLDKVLINSKRGYLTMNTGIGGSRGSNKLSLLELKNLLPNFVVLQEDPLTYKYNYLIVWGFENKNLSKYFAIKKL